MMMMIKMMMVMMSMIMMMMMMMIMMIMMMMAMMIMPEISEPGGDHGEVEAEAWHSPEMMIMMITVMAFS